jgi:hypothetical protein
MRVGDRISILHAVPADPQGSSSQI